MSEITNSESYSESYLGHIKFKDKILNDQEVTVFGSLTDNGLSLLYVNTKKGTIVKTMHLDSEEIHDIMDFVDKFKDDIEPKKQKHNFLIEWFNNMVLSKQMNDLAYQVKLAEQRLEKLEQQNK